MHSHDYPDVLGALTPQKRLDMETLHCAVGVYPTQVAVGQPFETLTVLQSTIDQPQKVKLIYRLPRRDMTGRRLSFFLPKKEMEIRLGPGEVGMVHLPVVAQPPTPPARGYAITLHVQARPQTRLLVTPQVVRSPGKGRPPSTLSVSEVHFDVLKEVAFYGGDKQPNHIRVRFDVIPGHVKPGASRPAFKYEVLWTEQDLVAEQARIDRIKERAERLAFEFTRGEIFYNLEETTRRRFAEAGLSLDQTEALFITKALTYTYEEAFQFEKDFTPANSRWFRWLCCLMLRDSGIEARNRGELAALELYDAALYDAVVVTWAMVQLATRERYGTAEEQRAYAEQVVRAVQGDLPITLRHAYFPLIMGGALLNVRQALRYENPWESLYLLEEVRRKRFSQAGPDYQALFNALDGLIASTREMMRRERIPESGF